MTELRGELQLNAPLTKLNTWFVGGNAKQLYLPADLADLAKFIKNLPLDDEPLFIGLGSNLLIRDSGIPNTVILTQGRLNELKLIDELSLLEALCNSRKLEIKSGQKIFYAQAGVTCAKVAKFCVANNLVQGEFFAGIPGTVGGALAMNAGAFGGETWPRVVAVATVDREGKIHTRTPDEYEISYRTVRGPGIPVYSRMKEEQLNSPSSAIDDGDFSLDGGVKQLREWFVGAYFQLPIGNGHETQQRIKALLAKRKETQPIGLPSCGSVFKNPQGDHAARLIEASGLKGYRIGGAEVSPKHANFIINTGDATAQDIEMLINYVRATVASKYHIQLITEVRIVGIANEN